MRPLAMRTKISLWVSAIVVGTGLLISSVAAQRYSASLARGTAMHAEALAHAVSLEAAEMVLTNDLVSLHKLLENQLKSNPSVSYIFIVRNGRILADTFERGIPVQLIDANKPFSKTGWHLQDIISKQGQAYLDVAWPIFEGNAGVLRIGVSKSAYQRQVARLWRQMGILTLLVLLLAVVSAHVFIRRLTKPLGALSQAAQSFANGKFDVRVENGRDDEVGRLALSFNLMLDRIQDYTRKLEEKHERLEHVYQQTHTFCEVIRDIAGLPSLDDVASLLLKHLGKMLKCKHVALVAVDEERPFICAYAGDQNTYLLEPSEEILSVITRLSKFKEPTYLCTALVKEPLLKNPSFWENGQWIFPVFHENRFSGAVLLGDGGPNLPNQEVEIANFTLSQSSAVLQRVLKQEKKKQSLRRRVETRAGFADIIGKDSKMQVIYGLIEDVASTDATILIQGESGTGKEVVAQAIHRQSHRKTGPFIVINCSAYPETLLESELFGHEKGAFTGAIKQKMGRFEQADGGTIFLDEIGEVSPSGQIKLLRVLQSQRFERLGGEKTLSVNIRVVAASNRNLLEAVKQRRFREDLYYRLNVVPIHLPPLRERRNDIPLLARHFLHRFSKEQGKVLRDFTPEAMRLLLDYLWPGNVRELENTVEHAVILAKNPLIVPYDLPSAIADSHAKRTVQEDGKGTTLEETERRLLNRSLEECNWNKKAAAKRLGISRSTLYEKMKKHGIRHPTQH